MGALVQQHSTLGTASSSQVETFSAAVAANLLVIVAAISQNGGANFFNTPSGWTQIIPSYAFSASNPKLGFYTKVAAGGETSVTVTSTSAFRFQTWFGEFNGYTATLDADAGGVGTSGAVTTGDTATATPTVPGGLWIGAVAVKNAEASLSNPGGYSVATVNNEGGASSTQKVQLGVWYDLNSTSAERQQPVWSTIAAPYSGTGIILQPAAAPVTLRQLSISGAGQ